ncbi:DegT/DnrJ/EryC1/StrS family aminotransferase [uncultured Roseivirga sp.]|uniref:DegT/DnrJ/EryC1/StrS family aminotransferase n=1 Tax=uncultured Roseivirga sp. TaxID=543088 RepID=UPI000D7B3A43|nr:DegT/DnrJ/EryC1/StrS family aminotransferase [uncultured Roseivirga sp.]PWL27233.1 MAG: aminotransferase DegT [Roseivirga sp. XM-24bin3]
MIPVTKPFLPPKPEFDKYVTEAWNRNWLTNNGPIINQLELKLKDHLNLPHFLLVLNGTIALQLAFKALNLRGKFITTPFSYIATVSSAVWEGLEPVFVDIDTETFNIDPDQIEDKISDDVSCIVATHVFGNPCNIEAIQKIASKYSLPVIYDAAHTFGVRYKGKSLMSYGTISTLSLHATKLYHMTEGGAVSTNDPDLLKHMAFARNFGHKGETFEGVGINGKNSEFHAAMGLANYPYINQIIEKRRKLTELYNQIFDQNNVNLGRQRILSDTDYNYAYYPVVFEDEGELLRVIKSLEGNYIHPRRYFYPSLNEIPYVPYQAMRNSESLSKRILCLPLYYDLTESDVEYITRIIIRTLKYRS